MTAIANQSPSSLLLSRLEGVIKTCKGWRARCPHCGGKGQKLAIAEGDNGTLLVTCFSCHDTYAVLAAVGLTVADLFIRKDLRSMTPSERSQLRQAALIPRWHAALNVLVTEANVVLAASNQLGDNRPLNDADLTRVRLCALRIFDAAEVLHGN
ncbi:hypothetical protein B0E46_09710 [Rhodanobacter sp. B04]|uniref:hypothetical protein n=1 Tax=Rhodanobacter sp. B04 TaxID=1945860 RepID=UPI0009C676AF|nr:hypothetical protein [Rhodanobacter sp. B04]OOG63285.1 hypothetical protein B0E46_09710 [Rhodanobacter sp. B04]